MTTWLHADLDELTETRLNFIAVSLEIESREDIVRIAVAALYQIALAKSHGDKAVVIDAAGEQVSEIVLPEAVES